MTKLLVDGFGWVYIVLVLEWYTKRIVGYDAGTPCTARHWLTALDMAMNQQFPQGARDQGVSLMSDHGCQPTAITFMEACSTLGIRQAFTSDHNPKGNADTERVMRTLKEEYLWLNE
jgi:putative transposase